MSEKNWKVVCMSLKVHSVIIKNKCLGKEKTFVDEGTTNKNHEKFFTMIETKACWN